MFKNLKRIKPTGPSKISFSLNMKLTLALADSFSACIQNRTWPFSKISTANSDLTGTAVKNKIRDVIILIDDQLYGIDFFNKWKTIEVVTWHLVLVKWRECEVFTVGKLSMKGQ